MRHRDIDAERAGQRLDNYLLGELKGVPRSHVYRLIRSGQVRVNSGRTSPSYRLRAGDRVRVPPVGQKPAAEATATPDRLEWLGARIIYEDTRLLVLDKPAGFAVHGGSGLSWGLIDAVRQARPEGFAELAHRLDRETSGCIVLALNGRALRHLSAEFRSGRVVKRYLCLLDGLLPQPVVTVDAPIGRAAGPDAEEEPGADGAREARTRFTALQRFRDCTYAEAELFTGRTHQIRVHAAHLGMPLAGDTRYADRAAARKWMARGLRRLFLHAHRLEFCDAAGNALAFSAPLPAALHAVLDGLPR